MRVHFLVYAAGSNHKVATAALDAIPRVGELVNMQAKALGPAPAYLGVEQVMWTWRLGEEPYCNVFLGPVDGEKVTIYCACEVEIATDGICDVCGNMVFTK